MSAQHKTLEELTVYLESSVGSKEEELIEEHLAECDECISSLDFLNSLKRGLKEFRLHSQTFVKKGLSLHLTNDEIRRYINDACNEDEKRRICPHLAGCDKCFHEVIAIEKVLEQLEFEEKITNEISVFSKFIISYPTRVSALEKEGKEIIREAVRNCIAPFLIGRAFSYSFKGSETLDEGVGKEYRKMETDDFTIEIVQPAGKESKVIIGVLAKSDLKNAKVTICAEEEKSEIVLLENRRAVINKENLQAETIRYIKIEKI